VKQKAAVSKALTLTSAGGKPAFTNSTSRESAAAISPAPTPKSLPIDAATTHNRELQLNMNNERFWKARGYDERPADWKTRDPAAGPKGS